MTIWVENQLSHQVCFSNQLNILSLQGPEFAYTLLLKLPTKYWNAILFGLRYLYYI